MPIMSMKYRNSNRNRSNNNSSSDVVDEQEGEQRGLLSDLDQYQHQHQLLPPASKQEEDESSSSLPQSSYSYYYYDDTLGSTNHHTDEDDSPKPAAANIISTKTMNKQEEEQEQESPQNPPVLVDVVVSSLDFERIVNDYSIQMIRDQWFLSSETNDQQQLPPATNTSTSRPPLRRRQLLDSSQQQQQTQRDESTKLNEDDDEKKKIHDDVDVETGRRNNPKTSNEQQQQRRRRGKRRKRKHHHYFLGSTGRTITRWFLSCLVALLTGLTSILIVKVTETIVTWRINNFQELIVQPIYSDEIVFSIFCILNVLAAITSSCLCLFWVPTATGSGISQVKAYLNGIRTTNTTTTSTTSTSTQLSLFIVKVIGTILSVSSGLAIGMEGPLIHIGAMMGYGCSKLSGILAITSSSSSTTTSSSSSSQPSSSSYPNSKQWYLLPWWSRSELGHFATDAERRDLMSIGASCGFAASFGAPIGGLLFILDDISSYFNKNLLLRILIGNAIGTFCLAIEHDDLSNYSVINLGTYSTTPNTNIFINRVEELPLYILIGIMGGILGGCFTLFIMSLQQKINNRLVHLATSTSSSSSLSPQRQRDMWQLGQVVLISLLTSILIFYLPNQQWACKTRQVGDNSNFSPLDYTSSSSSVTTATTKEHERFFCPPGQVNELATILFGSRIDAIKRILTDPSQFTKETLLTVGILFYGLMIVTFGTALPSGIFTPSVLIGASLGGATGLFIQETIDSEVTPSTFALLGVAALLAGIQRSTVSLAVILVEGTGQVKVLLPAIITVVVARYVASFIYDKGIFEAVMDWHKLPYLSHNYSSIRRYDAIECGEIMSVPPLEFLPPLVQAKDVVELLEQSSHHGFPVIDPLTKKLLGLVRRDQLAALLECGVFFDRNGNKTTVTNETPTCSTTHSTLDLLQWAYHINDDRYDHVLEEEMEAAAPTVRGEKLTEPRIADGDDRKIPQNSPSLFAPLPTEFAKISKNTAGLLYASWFNPTYETRWVNVGAVMNRGVYCVTEFCPVSKAYTLFTSLGLRHLVVLGGSSGGTVVGIITRANLLPQFIEDQTGL